MDPHDQPSTTKANEEDIKMENTEMNSDLRNIKERMLERVAKSNAHFKHQQLGESDLTKTEKLQIAEEILNKGDNTFLARFWQHLSLEDMDYFRERKNDYEVNFYLREIRKNCNAHFCTNVVKNRRYEAMKKLEHDGEYFSEEEMKYRDPFLYEQLIGQFITEEEAQKMIDKSDLRFSTILLKHMDNMEEKELYKMEKEREECQVEEEDTSDEEEEIEDDTEEISEEKRQDLRAEFTRIMKERFMAGEDRHFDYSSVDHNADYDDLDLLDRDEEEKYFNTEEDDSVFEASEEMDGQIDRQTEAMCLEDSPCDQNDSEMTSVVKSTAT
ncbi:coiled-coil domain-containing protein 97-like [Saccostrea cucullata]|uniref:coiled-coil domain-containing protein 97-like n=1 Tax=Saccostrea cuccullata TaxID=36930 RepID=UPI002ED6A9D6